MVLDPHDLVKPGLIAESTPPASSEVARVPLGGTRQERMHRLQIGVVGIVMIMLLIALADIISGRAQETQANAVPEAAPTVVASEASAPSDPLADAGVVPALPVEPSAAASGSGNAPTTDVPPPTSVQNAPLQ